MTITVGNYETISLDIAPYDDDTAVSVALYSPTGVVVALVDALVITPGTGPAAGTAMAAGTAGYDEPGTWIQIWTVTGTGAGVSHRSVYVAPLPVSPDVVWPPTLAQLKADLDVDPDDTEKDIELARQLAAAVAWVTYHKADTFNFDDESGDDRRDPSADLALGTVRLAGRWNARKRSVDGLVSMGELGVGRVPSFDPDIERLLGIGRFAPPVIA